MEHLVIHMIKISRLFGPFRPGIEAQRPFIGIAYAWYDAALADDWRKPCPGPAGVPSWRRSGAEGLMVSIMNHRWLDHLRAAATDDVEDWQDDPNRADRLRCAATANGDACVRAAVAPPFPPAGRSEDLRRSGRF
jgi:hypothetical protein